MIASPLRDSLTAADDALGDMLDNIFRISLCIASVMTTAATAWLGNVDKPGAAVTTAALTAVLCAFVFLARFKRFKALWFEGER